MTIHRRTLAALGLVLLLASSSAIAAGPARKVYPAGIFTAAGKPISPREIFDARALPDLQGKPSLMITLSPAAAASAVTAAAGVERVPCTLDGKPLGDSATATLMSDHVLQLSGDFGDYSATAALARRISGRDPLPDAESDQ